MVKGKHALKRLKPISVTEADRLGRNTPNLRNANNPEVVGEELWVFHAQKADAYAQIHAYIIKEFPGLAQDYPTADAFAQQFLSDFITPEQGLQYVQRETARVGE